MAVTFNVYASDVTMDTGAMPTPVATGLTTQSYVDTAATPNQNRYYRVGAVQNSIEKISDELVVYISFTAPYNLVGTLDSPEIDYSFDADGAIESYNYYRSLTTMDTGAMPTPVATGITSKLYTDTTADTNQTYYVRFGSVKDGVEKISDEITVDTTVSATDPYFSDVDYLIMVDSGAIVDKSNNARTITNNNGVSVSGDQMIFDGSSYLSLNTQSLDVSFTVEWFAARNLSVSDQFMGMWSSNSTGYYPHVMWGYGNAYLTTNSGGQVSSAVVNNGNENHWCLEYDKTAGIAYLFYNGNKIAQITQGTSGWVTTLARIGRVVVPSANFTGSMRAVRCTLDVIRYDVAGFTPPTEFPTS